VIAISSPDLYISRLCSLEFIWIHTSSSKSKTKGKTKGSTDLLDTLLYSLISDVSQCRRQCTLAWHKNHKAYFVIKCMCKWRNLSYSTIKVILHVYCVNFCIYVLNKMKISTNNSARIPCCVALLCCLTVSGGRRWNCMQGKAQE
jgi:hypothetical protein